MDLNFQSLILHGIPDKLPPPKGPTLGINHAPRRKDVLSPNEKILALSNALRYFPPDKHDVLALEFAQELEQHGRIYMYRLRPDYEMRARHISEYPHNSLHAAAMMGMIQNNLDPRVAQHPEELITYGGNGTVFQNWAQYLLTMKYLASMGNEQTLIMNSGHPQGLFPSNKNAPRVVISNGIIIPNHSSADDYERLAALGVSLYGQMTAGSWMYIGPQGIVHGTAITILNAGRRIQEESLEGKLFVSSGLGGMSGAQAKAAVIAGAVGVIAEVNQKALEKRFSQGWLNEKYDNLDRLLLRIERARSGKESVSLGYLGNVVDLWERLAKEGIHVDLGSDQTSLHNPFAGGYYPVGVSFEDANEMIVKNPSRFKELVYSSLKRQVDAINLMSESGTYFFDYGNAFLLRAKEAGADILNKDGSFRHPSYVQHIMGPVCFDYGFGPFRWVCTSQNPDDLAKTDAIATDVIRELSVRAPSQTRQQYLDNLRWIGEAGKNNLVVGSQARILYSDLEGRIAIATEFNKAIQERTITAPIVLGRDHHDVSGTDSPYRETSDITDGSSFTADMAMQNVIGDAFRGATWVSIHNGGGVGWGEVINGGFGMVLDGSKESYRKIKAMIEWDVANGLARRSWARHEGAEFAIKNAMRANPKMKVTMPYLANPDLVASALGIK